MSLFANFVGMTNSEVIFWYFWVRSCVCVLTVGIFFESMHRHVYDCKWSLRGVTLGSFLNFSKFSFLAIFWRFLSRYHLRHLPKNMVPRKNCRVRSKNFFWQKYQFSPKIKVFSGHINQNLELKKYTASCTRPSNTQWPSEALSPVR